MSEKQNIKYTYCDDGREFKLATGGELTVTISDEGIEMLHELVDEANKSMQQALCKAKFPNGEERHFKVNKIRQNMITYFKKCGKRYKRYIKPSCEFIFEGISYEWRKIKRN